MEVSISKHKLKHSAFLMAFVVISVVTELFYRQSLFDYSIELEGKWQRGMSQTAIGFFKAVTHLGSEYITLLHMMWVYFFTPLSFSFTYSFGMIFTFYLFSIMKIWYGAERPFWHVPSLSLVCDGGFGNPSGHSVCSMFIYLGINRLIANASFIKGNAVLQLISSILFIGLIGVIIVSRLILGIHSINQVIYGASLGLAVYYAMYHIIEGDKLLPGHFKKLFVESKCIIAMTCFYCLCLVAAILSFYLISTPIEKQLLDNVRKACPHLKAYRMLNNDGLFGSYVLFLSIGCYYGLVFLWLITRKWLQFEDTEVINWSMRWTKLSGAIKTIAFNVVCVIPGLLFLLPVYEGNYPLGFLLKLGLPAGLTMFLEYSLAIYLSLKYTERTSVAISLNKATQSIGRNSKLINTSSR